MRELDVGQIPGLEKYRGRYIIYEDGSVYSIKSKKYLKHIITKKGYHYVTFFANGERVGKNMKVHRLVALAFIPNPDGLPQVGHWDDDKDNNDISNLYWTDAAENNRHGNRLQKLSKRVYCVELDKVYDSMTAAAADMNVNVSCISQCVNGNQMTAAGYHWRRYEDVLDK